MAQGVEALPHGKRRRKLEAALQEIMLDYTIVPFGGNEGLEWGRYVNSVGRPLPIMDSLIAATALANGFEVVTENTDDFPGVPAINPAQIKKL